MGGLVPTIKAAVGGSISTSSKIIVDPPTADHPAASSLAEMLSI
jgi:hypothetical protein